MSQLLQVATRSGKIFVLNTSPAYFDQGLPYSSEGALAFEEIGPIDHYHQGLPFTIGNRLSATLNGTVARIAPGGAPFDASGFLVFGDGDVDHFASGIPYTATNQIASTGVAPIGGFSNGFSSGFEV